MTMPTESFHDGRVHDSACLNLVECGTRIVSGNNVSKTGCRKCPDVNRGRSPIWVQSLRKIHFGNILVFDHKN